MDQAKPQTHAPETEENLQENVGPEATGPEGTAETTPTDTAAEIERLKDQLLRAMAESENTRRRMKKEVEDAQKYAISGFAKEILTVSDNFRRALEAVQTQAVEGETLKNLVEGVQATERQLMAIMDRFGIQKIETLGKPFDPHFHQVMMEMEDPSKPAGMVLQVLQDGYMIHGRLLRDAMVVVAKGGPTTKKVDTSA